MPTYVNPDKCDGCKALDKPACMYICPSDIMHLDKSIGKAFNIEPDLCWECYACVKTCPQTAIDMRGYGDVMPMGASLAPLRGTDSIMWTVKFRNGQVKRFKYAIRTTPWGSIEPFQGLPVPKPGETKEPGLCGDARYLGVDKLPVVSKN
ncbi:MAG: adenylyl-sulfate reductase subunit beta [Candidatus Methylomirabilales bacterium]